MNNTRFLDNVKQFFTLFAFIVIYCHELAGYCHEIGKFTKCAKAWGAWL